MSSEGPILRVFEVHAKPDCVSELLGRFATTSAQVVDGKPGNRGYFFGRCIEGNGEVVLFASIWEDVAAIQARFGHDWQTSYLPEGYADLIESCAVRHFDLADGWRVAMT